MSLRVNAAANLLGSNIKRLRLSRGVSREELASKLPMSRAKLSAIEAGQGNPTLKTMVMVAEYLSVPLAQLLTV